MALAELYRQWDYTEQAISIAEQGAAIVPGSNEVSDIWYEVGMGYDDKRLDDKAIEAFTKSLESKRDNHKAKFQRGQAYFRKGDFTNAKKDLEEFSKTGGASVEFAKQQASKMLLDIAAKSAMQNNTTTPEAPAGGNKKMNVTFYATVWGSSDKSLSSRSIKVDKAFDAATYQQILDHGMMVPIDVEIPAGGKELRLAVLDNKTGFIGTVSGPLGQ